MNFNKSSELMYKISIIIPVYNAEKYLKRTINSIIFQTFGFKNIELILVDDGSTDGSRKIIEEYSSKYSNILSIFNKVNHSYPGYARNKGIEVSTAKYIMFADNDDEYALDYCETMYNAIESYDVDIVSSNFSIQKKSEIVKIDIYSKIASEIKFNKSPLLIELDKYIDLYDPEIWIKIFKSTLIKENNLKFIESGLNEDSLFINDCVFHAKNILFIDYYGYTWYRDEDNLSYYSVKSTSDFIDSYYKLFNQLKERYELSDWNNKFIKGSVHMSIIRIIFSSDNKKDYLFLLEKLYDFEKYAGFNGNLDIKWANILNNLILKRKFITVIFLMKLLKYGKNGTDFIKHNLLKM